MTRLSTAILLLLFLAVAARAAEVRWEPSSGTLGVGQTSPLELVFEDCEPSEPVRLPDVPDVNFGRPSQSSQTSIVNFQRSSRTVLTYPVLPIRKGRMTIPSFEVATDRGRLRVPAATFEVGDATVGQSNLSIEAIAGSQLTTEPPTVWAGEVFQLNYQLLIVRRFNPTSVGDLEWEAPAGLVTDPWAKPETVSTVIGGEPRVGFAYRTRAYAREPGRLTLPPARQLINLETGSRGFGLFTRPTIEQYLIASEQPTITVRPLPQPAPPDFARAVGDFRLESRVVPQAAAVGEPVTWTLTLAGTGNWPEGLALPAREASRDFQVIRPQVQRTPTEGTLFEGTLTEDVVLVPTRPGTYTLGPVTYTYFDPKRGEYRALRTDTATVIVRPASAPAAPAPGSPAATLPTPASSREPPPAPPPPDAMPLDPLAGTTVAPVPWERPPWPWVAAAAAVLAVFWLGLALRHAAVHDPLRARRAALRRLPAALESVRTAADTAARHAALRRWQETAIAALGVAHAAPAPAAVAAAAGTEWARLWEETEACLYGRPGTLPDDWTLRAAVAARAVRIPGFRPWRALHPAHFWPLLALAALLAPAPDARAADPLDDYRAARFAAAERGWREQLAQHPGNWRARHNLGLALAQQERWSEATAHWAAAFVLRPADPAVRFHLALGLGRADFTAPLLADLAAGRGLGRVARLASPAAWQRGLLAALGLITLAAAAYLWDRYAGRRRWRLALAGLLAAAALALAVLGTAALHAWGPLADPAAALAWETAELRSVPTEAGEAQQTQPLGAGTIARADRAFLGWRRLVFPDGQTGWVRREHLVELYR